MRSDVRWKGAAEALLVWYEQDVGGRYAAVEQSRARSAKGWLIVLRDARRLPRALRRRDCSVKGAIC